MPLKGQLGEHQKQDIKCLNCGKSLTYDQKRHRYRNGRRPKFCSQKCHWNYYFKTHPEHQRTVGRLGGIANVKIYPEGIRKAYSVLTPELRRENKRMHDQAVVDKANELKNDGFLIVFQDSWSKQRPDIIAYKEGELYLMDVKTNKVRGEKRIRVVQEKIKIP